MRLFRPRAVTVLSLALAAPALAGDGFATFPLGGGVSCRGGAASLGDPPHPPVGVVLGAGVVGAIAGESWPIEGRLRSGRLRALSARAMGGSMRCPRLPSRRHAVSAGSGPRRRGRGRAAAGKPLGGVHGVSLPEWIDESGGIFRRLRGGGGGARNFPRRSGGKYQSRRCFVM